VIKNRWFMGLAVCWLAGLAVAADVPLVAPIVVGPRVLVSWNGNTEYDLAGYKIYFFSSGADTNFIDVADTTSLVVFAGYDLRQFYDRSFFAVSAYNKSGAESDWSKLDSIQVAKTKYLFGDLDGDGRVGVIDFALFCRAHGAAAGDSSYDCRADFDVNRKVGAIDFMAFVLNHGQKL
jgi:hypothetical protein